MAADRRNHPTNRSLWTQPQLWTTIIEMPSEGRASAGRGLRPKIADCAVPWGDEVRAGSYGGHPSLLYPQRPRTFAEFLFGVERWAPRTFLVHGDRRIDFGHFFGAVALLRNSLQPLGIAPGDRVMLLAYNGPEWVLALWAIWSAERFGARQPLVEPPGGRSIRRRSPNLGPSSPTHPDLVAGTPLTRRS